jgi:putative ABC transport system ATP-binding protein
VAIARALVGKPDLLLADEPTSALDSNSAAIVGRMLREAAHQFHMAVVVTTHDPRIGDIADRNVRLEAGQFHA